MNLQEILDSEDLVIHEVIDFEDKILHHLPTINRDRYNEIVSLAKRSGLLSVFRNQSPQQNSHSLFFFNSLWKLTKKKEDFALYEEFVKSFHWENEEESLPHYFRLYEINKNPDYARLIRTFIDNSFEFYPDQDKILEKVIERRREKLVDALRISEKTLEELQKQALLDPTTEELEVLAKDLIFTRKMHAFRWGTHLYSLNLDTEDLARSVKLYNASDRNHFTFYSFEDDLKKLVQASGKNALREEYIRIQLEKAEEDWNLGVVFNDFTDLFFMTHLPEDKKNLDQIMERGITVFMTGISTNFSNFTHRFFDLYQFTHDKKYLEKFMSLKHNNKHPYFMHDARIEIPLFEVTGDSSYIPQIIEYAKSFIENRELRTAESLYFMLFEKTKDKQYYNKAREIFERLREEVSEEKPRISFEALFGIIDDVVANQNKATELLIDEEIPHESLLPSRQEVNTFEVYARVIYSTERLMEYVKHFPLGHDFEELRSSILLMKELNPFNNYTYLFNLYQITGDRRDFCEIEKEFSEYVKKDHDFLEHRELLKQLLCENE